MQPLLLALALIAALPLAAPAGSCMTAVTVGGLHGHAYISNSSAAPDTFGSGAVAAGAALPAALVDATLLSLSAGGFFSCSVNRPANASAAAALPAGVGALACWGVGLAATVPPALAAGGPYLQVSSGGYSACAITANKSALVCWGADEYQQVTGMPVALTTTGGVLQASIGTYHGCAVVQGSVGGAGNKTIACWGRDAEGQVSQVPPVFAAGTQTLWAFLSVSCGGFHCCGVGRAQIGVAFNGDPILAPVATALCWGDNSAQQSAGGTALLGSSSSLTRIAAGGRFTCATPLSGVVCWGATTRRSTSVPAVLAQTSGYGAVTVTALSCGWYGCCALYTSPVDLLAGTQLSCWGEPFETAAATAPAAIALTTAAARNGSSGGILITTPPNNATASAGGSISIVTGSLLASSPGATTGAILIASGSVSMTAGAASSGAVSVVAGGSGSGAGILLGPGLGSGGSALPAGGTISLLASTTVATGALAVQGSLVLRKNDTTSSSSVTLNATTLAALLTLLPPPPPVVQTIYAGLFSQASAVAVHPTTNLVYVADAVANRVHLVDGAVNSSAASPSAGFVDTLAVVCSSPADSTVPLALRPLSSPQALAIDDTGSFLYIADTGNHLIRVVDLTTKTCSTLAGSASGPGSVDNGTVSSFAGPGALAWAPSSPSQPGPTRGWLWVADTGNRRIRRINLDTSVVTTVAGTGTLGSSDATNGLQASFTTLYDLAWVAASDTLLAADVSGYTVRAINCAPGANYSTATLAGTAQTRGLSDGIPGSFRSPSGLALHHPSTGVVWVADPGNCCMRQVALSTGAVSPAAGMCYYPLMGTCDPGQDGTLLPTAASALAGATPPAKFNAPQKAALHTRLGAFFVVEPKALRRVPVTMPSPSPSPSTSPTASATATATSSVTPSLSTTGTSSTTVTPSMTVTASTSATPSITPSITATRTPSGTRTTSVTPAPNRALVRTVVAAPLFANLTAVAALNSSHILTANFDGTLYRVAVNTSAVTQLPRLTGISAISAIVTDPASSLVYIAGQCQVFFLQLDTATNAGAGGSPAAVIPVVGSTSACQPTPANGTASSVRLSSPAALVLDPNVNVGMTTDAQGFPAISVSRKTYITDTFSNNIRTLTCTLTISATGGLLTTACSVDVLVGDPLGSAGFVNAAGTAARMTGPVGAAYYNHPANGPLLYVCTPGSQALRYVTLNTATLNSWYGGSSYYPKFMTFVPGAYAPVAGAGQDLLPFTFEGSSKITYGNLPGGLQKDLTSAVPGNADGAVLQAGFSNALACLSWDPAFAVMFVCDTGNAKLRAVTFT